MILHECEVHEAWQVKGSERGVSEDMILRAISEPASAYYDLGTGAIIVFRKLDEKRLLVAYTREDGEVKVITTFITSVAEQLIEGKLRAGVWVEIG